ncbi:MAG: glycosyltransferase family 2 protein [Tissierellales bacterium]|nr:glycosyltransferase family 2 protein [Tissierellales bacterium]MBN2826720.1 glycosyltransferase family 2 protein [Tissierellales bacterium]
MLSVVIPVYNGSDSLRELCESLKLLFSLNQWDYEIILVDDGSTDNSRQTMSVLSAEDPHIISIFLDKNYGQQNAIFCGLNFARGELILNMDDDLQHPVHVIPSLLHKMSEGYDIVYAISPVKYKKRYRNLGSKMTDRIFTWFLKKPAGKRISSYRIIRKSIVDKIISENYRYVYISASVMKHTKNIANVEYEKPSRKFGNSNYNFLKQVKIFARIILYYTHFKPFQRFRKKGGQYGISNIINR